jgi:hypothetical protein
VRHPCAIGQPDAGAALSGGNYTLGGGFWSLFAAPDCRTKPASKTSRPAGKSKTVTA